MQRHVDRTAWRVGCATLVDKARSRKQRQSTFVDRYGQHLRVAPEERLRAVAVVHVEVDVEDAVAGVAGTRHAERDVVVDTEAARSRRGCVMEAAAWMERVLDLTTEDAIDGV